MTPQAIYCSKPRASQCDLTQPMCRAPPCLAPVVYMMTFALWTEGLEAEFLIRNPAKVLLFRHSCAE